MMSCGNAGEGCNPGRTGLHRRPWRGTGSRVSGFLGEPISRSRLTILAAPPAPGLRSGPSEGREGREGRASARSAGVDPCNMPAACTRGPEVGCGRRREGQGARRALQASARGARAGEVTRNGGRPCVDMCMWGSGAPRASERRCWPSRCLLSCPSIPIAAGDWRCGTREPAPNNDKHRAARAGLPGRPGGGAEAGATPCAASRHH